MTTASSSVETFPHRATDGPPSEERVEKAVLLTVHYQDLFAHAPTLEQVQGFLIGCAAGPEAVRRAVRRLEERSVVVVRHRRIMWPGREDLAEQALAREAASLELWRQARRIARWLRAVPFVRLVGVTGSLSVNHAERGHDLDLLCVAAPGRVWQVVAWLRAVHHCARRLTGTDLCANCVLDESDLQVRNRNLYLAHQIAQMAPLWGGECYRRFLAANDWIREFLPNGAAGRAAGTVAPGRSLLQRAAEWPWTAAVGDTVDRHLFQAGWRRALSFYRPTHPVEVIADARHPRRYMMPGQGYGPSVYRRFLDGHPRLTGLVSRAELAAVFGVGPGAVPPPDPRLDAILSRRYAPTPGPHPA